jgi:hypothetical protein
MEFYAATKKNEILAFASGWNWRTPNLNEVGQAQKAESHMCSLIRRL